MSLEDQKIIGIIPASGRATRLGPLPCSKEIFPLGMIYDEKLKKDVPQVLSHHLLKAYQKGQILDAFFLIRHDKWDIPKYFAQYPLAGMNLAYIIIDRSPSVTFTIDQVFPFAKDHVVALGFPDILFEPLDAFNQMRLKQQQTAADVVLGLFPIEKKEKWDMVEIENSKISGIVIKPGKTNLKYGWTLALWNSRFSEYLHEFVKVFDFDRSEGELYPGMVFQSAINSGKFQFDYVLFEDGWCRDLGTPEDLKLGFQ